MTAEYQFLTQALSDGFCLHGSPVQGIKVIFPRHAHCDTGVKERNQTAIYASKEGPRVPLLMACRKRLCYEVPSCYLSYTAESDEEPLLVEGSNITLGFGSVYILPRTTFKQAGDEYISRKPVSVHKEIVVGPSTIMTISHEYDFRIPLPSPWCCD